MPVTADFSRWTFRSQTAKTLFSAVRKSAFSATQFSEKNMYILRRCSQWRGLLDRSKIAPL